MKKLLSLLSWILGIFLIITGLLAAIDISWKAMGLVLAGLLVLPPVRRLVYNKTKIKIHFLLRSALVVFLAGVSMTIFGEQVERAEKPVEVLDKDASDEKALQVEKIKAVVFTPQQICRGAVAAIFSKPLSITKVYNIEKDVTYVSYVKPEDGTEWAIRCKIDGARVIWGSETDHKKGTGNAGRWRTHPEDQKISYSQEGNTLRLMDSSGDDSYLLGEFTIQKFKKNLD